MQPRDIMIKETDFTLFTRRSPHYAGYFNNAPIIGHFRFEFKKNGQGNHMYMIKVTTLFSKKAPFSKCFTSTLKPKSLKPATLVIWPTATF